MDERERSAYLVDEARRHDPERFLTALFAPAQRRDAMLAVILLHHELTRVPGHVREPMAGMIRYQWWRDAVDGMVQGGEPRRHPIAVVLDSLVRNDNSAAGILHALIDTHEQTLTSPVAAGQPAAEPLLADAGRLVQRLIYRALGGNRDEEEQAAADIGAGFSLATAARDVADPRRRDSLSERADTLLSCGRDAAGRPPRQVMAAFLLAALARIQLRRIRGLDRSGRGPPPPARTVQAPLALLLRFVMRRP